MWVSDGVCVCVCLWPIEKMSERGFKRKSETNNDLVEALDTSSRKIDTVLFLLITSKYLRRDLLK